MLSHPPCEIPRHEHFSPYDAKAISDTQVAILYRESMGIAPGYIELWDTNNAKQCQSKISTGTETRSLAVLKSKNQLINAADDKIRVLSLEKDSMKEIASFSLKDAKSPEKKIEISKLVLSPDEKYAFITHSQEEDHETMGIWDITGKEWKKISDFKISEQAPVNNNPADFIVTPDGSKLIYTSMREENVKIWNISSAEKPSLHSTIDAKDVMVQITDGMSCQVMTDIIALDAKHIACASRSSSGHKGLVTIFDISGSEAKCVSKITDKAALKLFLSNNNELGVLSHHDDKNDEITLYSLANKASPVKVGSIAAPRLTGTITVTPKGGLVCASYSMEKEVKFVAMPNTKHVTPPANKGHAGFFKSDDAKTPAAASSVSSYDPNKDKCQFM